MSVDIDASPRDVWNDIREIASHTEWMHDAVAIRFKPGPTSGVGTRFDCDTRVGPFRLTDQMEVTEWVPRKALGIRHVGVVTGTGRFRLRRRLRGGTRFVWEERLVFPWWLGGWPGSVVGAVVLRRLWKRNLGALKRRFDTP